MHHLKDASGKGVMTYEPIFLDHRMAVPALPAQTVLHYSENGPISSCILAHSNYTVASCKLLKGI